MSKSIFQAECLLLTHRLMDSHQTNFLRQECFVRHVQWLSNELETATGAENTSNLDNFPKTVAMKPMWVHKYWKRSMCQWQSRHVMLSHGHQA